MKKQIETVDDIPIAVREKFWEVVVAALVEIFNVEHAEALQMISSLRLNCEKILSPRGQVFVYHNEPLDVARVLAGKPRIHVVDEQFKQYQEICRRLGWT